MALTLVGVIAKTASAVSGVGRQNGKTQVYRGNEYHPGMIPKVKIEIAVPDSLAEKTIEKICETANTGHIGDGKIFTFDLDEAIRVRTGETGDVALGQGY